MTKDIDINKPTSYIQEKKLLYQSQDLFEIFVIIKLNVLVVFHDHGF